MAGSAANTTRSVASVAMVSGQYMGLTQCWMGLGIDIGARLEIPLEAGWGDTGGGA